MNIEFHHCTITKQQIKEAAKAPETKSKIDELAMAVDAIKAEMAKSEPDPTTVERALGVLGSVASIASLFGVTIR